MYPLLSNQYSRTFGLTTILIIWLCGITLGIVQWANTKATAFLIANEINYDCKEVWSPDESRVYTISLLIITFALPMSILSYAYGSVALKIFRHSTPGNADIVRDRAQHLSKIKVRHFATGKKCPFNPFHLLPLQIIKMLTTIVVLFAVCWLPLHVLSKVTPLYPSFLFQLTLLHWIMVQIDLASRCKRDALACQMPSLSIQNVSLRECTKWTFIKSCILGQQGSILGTSL